MKFVLVVHGDSVAGQNGSTLSETGRRQAEAVGVELGARSAAVFSSPAAAALEMASVIAGALGVDTPAVRGELECPDESSSLESVQEDMWSIIDAAKAELEADATLVLVTHEVNVRLLVCRALSMPLAEKGRFALEPGSMTTIEWRTQPRERLLVASLNEVCHLETPA